MVPEEFKKSIRESIAFISILRPASLEDTEWMEALEYAIVLRKPLYLMKERRFEVPGDLLVGADVKKIEEYDGAVDSPPFYEALGRLEESIKSDLGIDDIEYDFKEDSDTLVS